MVSSSMTIWGGKEERVRPAKPGHGNNASLLSATGYDNCSSSDGLNSNLYLEMLITVLGHVQDAVWYLPEPQED